MSPLYTSALLVLGLLAFAVTMTWRLRAMAALKPEPGNRLDRVGERVGALLRFGLDQRPIVAQRNQADDRQHDHREQHHGEGPEHRRQLPSCPSRMSGSGIHARESSEMPGRVVMKM